MEQGSYVSAPKSFGKNCEAMLSWYMEKRGLLSEDETMWNTNREQGISELSEFFAKFPECQPPVEPEEAAV